jgi:probable F420-dependent oxidoreductase
MKSWRFGLLAGHGCARDARSWGELVRRADDAGFDVLLVPDHLGPGLAPLTALAAAAGVSARLRLGFLVLGNDLRHPVLLAHECASLDALSGGRFELGLGAGWKASEYAALGLPYESASVRISRLGEALDVIGRVWSGRPFSYAGAHYRLDGVPAFQPPVQRPRPPVLVGGGGPKVLTVAAQRADVVSLMPRMDPDAAGGPVRTDDTDDAALRRKIDVVRAAAGERFGAIELSVTALHLDVEGSPVPAVPPAWRAMAGTAWGYAGSPTGVADRLRELRERHGIGYVVAMEQALPAMARVIAALRSA